MVPKCLEDIDLTFAKTTKVMYFVVVTS